MHWLILSSKSIHLDSGAYDTGRQKAAPYLNTTEYRAEAWTVNAHPPADARNAIRMPLALGIKLKAFDH